MREIHGFSTRSVESCEESQGNAVLRPPMQRFSTRSVESCEESRFIDDCMQRWGGFSTRSVESCEEYVYGLYLSSSDISVSVLALSSRVRNPVEPHGSHSRTTVSVLALSSRVRNRKRNATAKWPETVSVLALSSRVRNRLVVWALLWLVVCFSTRSVESCEESACESAEHAGKNDLMP